MQIVTPYDGIRDAGYDVHVNPGHDSPRGMFAVIEMGDGCDVRMTGRRADMERLLKAAAEALRMLDGAARPHAWQEGRHARCATCGQLRSEAIHRVCGAVAGHTGVTCSLPPGHDGRHEHRPDGRPAIVWGPGVTEPDVAATVYPCCGHCAAGPDGAPCGIPHDEDCDLCAETAALARSIATATPVITSDAGRSCPRHPGETEAGCRQCGPVTGRDVLLSAMGAGNVHDDDEESLQFADESEWMDGEHDDGVSDEDDAPSRPSDWSRWPDGLDAPDAGLRVAR